MRRSSQAADALAVATRQDRRKLRTRARLVEAARRVISRKGIDATTILDITEEADVGFGTFYNYFESKEAILAAASAEAVERHGDALDRLTAPLDDVAEAIAICVRHTARMVDSDPIWGWFVVRLGLYEEQIEAGLGHRLVRDIRRGIEARRFPRANVPLLAHAIGAAVWAVLRGKLSGTLAGDVDQDLAATVLRMLGIPADEARAIAARPLPPVALPAKESDP
jgi:AcrR family transcriptional regulator